MLITRKLGPDWFEAEAFAEGIKTQAPTRAAAVEELRATIAVKRFAANRLRVIRKATHLAYDPKLGCYVADCPAVGITAQGFTRQDAWDRFLYGLALADKARAAEATENVAALEAAQSEENPNG